MLRAHLVTTTSVATLSAVLGRTSERLSSAVEGVTLVTSRPEMDKIEEIYWPFVQMIGEQRPTPGVTYSWRTVLQILNVLIYVISLVTGGTA